MAIAKCFGCGIEKDMDILEASPFADGDGLTDEPIPPLFVLDCQGPQKEFRQVVVCHNCFHRLEPDMWISKGMWDNINPAVPYEKLPIFVAGLSDPLLVKPL
jgi:hypothetical protein